MSRAADWGSLIHYLCQIWGCYTGEYEYWLLNVMLCSLVEIYQIFGGTAVTIFRQFPQKCCVTSYQTAVFSLFAVLKISRISSVVRESLEKFTPDSIFCSSMSVHYLQRVYLLAPQSLCMLQKLIRNISCCPLFSLFPLQILLWEVIIPLSSASDVSRC